MIYLLNLANIRNECNHPRKPKELVMSRCNKMTQTRNTNILERD